MTKETPANSGPIGEDNRESNALGAGAEGGITEQDRALLQWIFRVGSILEEIFSNKVGMEEAEPEEGSSDNDD
jgi:hypothetical protein